MHDQIQFHVGTTSPSAASVYFTMRDGAKIVSAAGTFSGPFCEYARTLPTEFSVQLATHPAREQSIAESLIIDPCFWSPTLPFTYKVELQLQLESGHEISYRGTVGMRQWHAEQKSFYLGFRRTVLRGYRCHDLCDETIQRAHQQESALLVDPAGQTAYEAADRLGVGLVVDLRKAGESLHDQIHGLNWHPSAMVAMVNAEQLSQIGSSAWPRQCLLAQCLTAESQHSEISEPQPEVLAIELNAGERPPAWLAGVEQPTIALRRNVSEDQLQEPRRCCEMLQAELAPDFSLAGYFVSP
ncbi:MAG: hypothetical protein GXP26_08770 [Planctomycetes bacterium]|nr:hypothetical protein [Planctomycetota bacterium]